MQDAMFKKNTPMQVCQTVNSLSKKPFFLILSSFCRAKGFPERMASLLVCAQENVEFQWISGHAPEIHYSARPAGRDLFLLGRAIADGLI
jgi:hypothetical protein